jgi:hypothetical protein
MIDQQDRSLEILFVRDQKQFVSFYAKKQKCDYLLNVSKIIKDKFDQEIIVPNKIQAFLINYEIKKLIDKAINVRNRKYNRIIYVNNSLSVNTIDNTIRFLSAEYSTVKFIPKLVDPDFDPSSLSNIEIQRASEPKPQIA